MLASPAPVSGGPCAGVAEEAQPIGQQLPVPDEVVDGGIVGVVEDEHHGEDDDGGGDGAGRGQDEQQQPPRPQRPRWTAETPTAKRGR